MKHARTTLFSTFCFTVFVTAICYSQQQSSRLKIDFQKSFVLSLDTLILEELEMEDNSELILAKANHYINVKSLKVGKNCTISGMGNKGPDGKNGRSANSPLGICKNGVHGTDGTAGGNGENGAKIILVADLGILRDTLSINLNGGNGGDGGNGGNGSSGSRNTPHCKTHGGNGGDGGNGGNGGRGGEISLSVGSMEKMKLISLINFSNRGGYRGLGGNGGKGGYRGLGQSEGLSLNGKTGQPGKDGDYGPSGKPIFYSINAKL